MLAVAAAVAEEEEVGWEVKEGEEEVLTAELLLLRREGEERLEEEEEEGGLIAICGWLSAVLVALLGLLRLSEESHSISFCGLSTRSTCSPLTPASGDLTFFTTPLLPLEPP